MMLKRILRHTILFTAVLAMFQVSMAADEPVPRADATLEAAFQCPEDLPDDAARLASTQAYVSWVKEQKPEWSLRQLIEFRTRLLESHHCDATLAAMRLNASGTK